VLWTAGISTQEDLGAALVEASDAVRQQLAGAAPDLVLLFLSPQHAPAYASVPELLGAQFPGAQRIGCAGGGIIGAGLEVEHSAALSITAAVLPGVDVAPFHLDTPNPTPADWRSRFPEEGPTPHFVILPDPFSFDAEAFVHLLDSRFPGSKKIGGLASGGNRPGMNALFLNDQVFRAGAVGVALAGNLEVDTVVAQGCRPIGLPMFLTRCQGNIVYELDGEPCMEVLQNLFESLSTSDQQLAQRSLFLGVVMEEHRQEYRQGDYLIRNIIGTDRQREAIAVGAILQENQVVQFHLRDAATSSADLQQLLRTYTSEQPIRPSGALLFSCLGRGMHLYGEAHHDSRLLRQHLGDIPVAGFFCNGEIGPVKGTTFLHGYTSSFGLFRSKS